MRLAHGRMEFMDRILTESWFHQNGWQPHRFQEESWRLDDCGCHRLIHLSTGHGKTYAATLRTLEKMAASQNKGTRLLYISPLRALGNDLKRNIELPLEDMNLNLSVATRTGDTSAYERSRHKLKPPDVFITTPESLNLMLTTDEYRQAFSSLELMVVDEWHELMATKRGVQVQLAIQHLLTIAPKMRVTGLSATLGNPHDAAKALVGPNYPIEVISGPLKKEFEVNCLTPEHIDSFPWAGHLGLAMLEKVVALMDDNKTTLYFTNTRSQAERWYSELKNSLPEEKHPLIGLHHSSIERQQREAIEDGLKTGELSYVVCTSSLDLGVDFPKVDRVFQIGSAKSISRFLQRAGRSHHTPQGIPEITFVPTHALELFEFMALKKAMLAGKQEPLEVPKMCFDVLVQHLQTLSLAEGLDPVAAYREIGQTLSFEELTQEQFDQALNFLVTGGCLKSYDSYQKLKELKGRYYLANKELIRGHRLNMGTITSDPVITVQYMRGARLGTVEESFVSKLKKGSLFMFAGKFLKYVVLKDLKLYVKKASADEVLTPVWQGGRLPLSDLLSRELRDLLEDIALDRVYKERVHKDKVHKDRINKDQTSHELLNLLSPLIEVQRRISAFPKSDELLIETCQSKEGRHTFLFPFSGRLVHEGLAALLSFRLTQAHQTTVSFSVNEYGLEILGPDDLIFSTQELRAALSSENLLVDLEKSLSHSGLAKRQFKEIAQISGLVPQNQPGKRRTLKNLQTSTSLLFDVFARFEQKNLLYQQSLTEVRLYQFQEERMLKTLRRLEESHFNHRETTRPSPLAFPLIIERLGATVSGASLKERIEKLKKSFQALA